MPKIHEVYDPQQEIDMLAAQNLSARLASAELRRECDKLKAMLDFMITNQVVVGKFDNMYRAAAHQGTTWGWSSTAVGAIEKAMEGALE